ncbi:MAG TPA: hypothetical protein PLD54_05175, partial [Candidatus Levybacteria bacterium]|nr:hypothetical protein [Candidatus Levybacteria bacterium]
KHSYMPSPETRISHFENSSEIGTKQSLLPRYNGFETGFYEKFQLQGDERLEVQAELDRIFSGEVKLDRRDIPALVDDVMSVIGTDVRIDSDERAADWASDVENKAKTKTYSLTRFADPDEGLRIEIDTSECYKARFGDDEQNESQILASEQIIYENNQLSIIRKVDFPRGIGPFVFKSLAGDEFHSLNDQEIPNHHQAINTTTVVSVLNDLYTAYLTQDSDTSMPAEDI